MSWTRGPLIASAIAAWVCASFAAADIQRHARIVELLLRRHVARRQVLLPREASPGHWPAFACAVGEIGARLVDVLRPCAGQQHVELRLGGIAPRLGQRGGVLVGGRIDLGDDFALA